MLVLPAQKFRNADGLRKSSYDVPTLWNNTTIFVEDGSIKKKHKEEAKRRMLIRATVRSLDLSMINDGVYAIIHLPDTYLPFAETEQPNRNLAFISNAGDIIGPESFLR